MIVFFKEYSEGAVNADAIEWVKPNKSIAFRTFIFIDIPLLMTPMDEQTHHNVEVELGNLDEKSENGTKMCHLEALLRQLSRKTILRFRTHDTNL